MAARIPRRNELTLLRASAGSGKTYALVHRYLELALVDPPQFRRILALTFTNKATAEMKRRIVATTAALAQGEHPMLGSLSAALPGVNVPKQATALLAQMLHRYSWLAVQTIERFFLRVVRSFARELQLELSAEIDLDTDAALDAAVDHLMARIGREAELTEWLARFALARLDDDKGWNVERSLRALGVELFKESLDDVLDEAAGATGAAEGLSLQRVGALLDTLEARRADYRCHQMALGQQARELMDLYSLSVDSFAQKGRGVGGYLVALAQGEVEKEPTSYVRKALAGPEAWVTKSAPERDAVITAVNEGLGTLLARAVAQYDAELPFLNAARAVLRHGHTLPLMPALAEGLRAYREQRGVVLLSDVAALLDVVLRGAETSFVYEKLGVRYQHLLLDEFQDTSRRQWRNLRPLADEALASGHSVLVVGDAKQSIYRWRAGDPRLLLGIEGDFPAHRALIRPTQLEANYRSAPAVVGFNNRFFAEAQRLLEASGQGGELLGAAYGAQAAQRAARGDAEGSVEVHLLVHSTEQRFADRALELLVPTVKDLRTEGWRWADVAVLVRTNSEGRAAATALIAAGVPVVSAESLLVRASPRVQVLLSALELLAQPSHAVARAHLERWAERRGLADVDSLAEALLSRRRERLAATLPELSGELQRLLGLGAPDAFMLAFDQQLADYAQREGGDAAAFLAWWATQEYKLSIAAPEGTDAVRIITLHKAKGLEFPVVILPRLDWKLSSDHRTTLWARPQVAPFDQVPLLPVAASASPPEVDDVFAPERQAEYDASVLDSLNLLYVGFTRAAERLIAFAPVPKRGPDAELMRSVGELVHDVLSGPGWALVRSESGDAVLRLGRKAAPPQVESKTEAIAELAYPLVEQPTAHVRIRRRAADYAELLDSRRIGPIRWGQVMHAVLQRTTALADAERVLAELTAEGVLTTAAALCFEPEWRVRTEAELLLPSGQRLRPDRVLTRAGQLRLIEFKTTPAALQQGAEAEHRLQVMTYRDAAVALGYASVEAYLIYLDGSRSLEVA